MSPQLHAPATPAEPVHQRAVGRLVLTRRELEGVLIGEEIEIEILAVNCSTVRLAIKAPRDVRILRTELVDILGDAP